MHNAKATILCLALLVANVPAWGQTVAVSGPRGAITVTEKMLAELPRQTVRADEHGEIHSYEGVRLTELLKQIDAPFGDNMRGAALTQFLVVTAKDGYRVLFSLAETDAAVSPRVAILADRMDGKPLVEDDGPFRIVIEGDLRPARSVRMVERIELRRLDDLK